MQQYKQILIITNHLQSSKIITLALLSNNLYITFTYSKRTHLIKQDEKMTYHYITTLLSRPVPVQFQTNSIVLRYYIKHKTKHRTINTTVNHFIKFAIELCTRLGNWAK